LRKLTGLVIRGWHAQAPGLRKLVEMPELAGIDRLGLRVCSISARDVGLLGTRAWRELDLHSNTIGLRGVETALGDVSRLEVLDVGSSGIGDTGALALAKLPFERLCRLSVRRSALGPASLGELSRARGLATLAALDMSANHGVASFFADPDLPALVELDLHDTALDDDALALLLASPLAAQLRVLDLGGNQLTDARLLLEAELPALRTLNVSGNPLGERVRELKAGLPHVRVTARNAAG
jgi:Leucine-rich repeat (LRR) protein